MRRGSTAPSRPQVAPLTVPMQVNASIDPLCKSVGLAFEGSNPSPATTSPIGP